MPLLEANGLTLRLPDRSAKPLFGAAPLADIFRNIDFSLEPGESVGIVGESGSGKTSLARTLLRLYEPSEGRLRFDGHDITHAGEDTLRTLRPRMQAVFQDSLSSLNPRHRIGTILSQPMLAYDRVTDRREGWRIAHSLLERVGLSAAFADRYPHELSGGQRQRVGIARAIALKPDLVIADEIVSGLDVSTQAQILLLLRELKTDGSMVFISHDLSVVRVLCDRVLVMRQGEVVEQGPCAALFAAPAHAYTRNLLEAIPLPEPEPGWIERTRLEDETDNELNREEQAMKVQGSIALVTGANRGIGREFVKALIAGGARKVYATARKPDRLKDLEQAHPGKIHVLTLDITKPAQVAAAASQAGDVTLLINNAGINRKKGLIASAVLDDAHDEMNTNYFGTLSMCRAFAPVLKKNGGGAIINMISLLARVSLPAYGSLCASKAALWSLTHSVRAELAKQGTFVMGVMPGACDTDMERDFQGPKEPPENVVAAALKALEDGEEDIFPGGMAQGVTAGLAKDPKAVEKEFAKYLPG
ncbi:MAG: SDR family oxidoreductase [Burkholderiales bacterium]